MTVRLGDDERWLSWDLGGPHATLSWALVGGGFGVHEQVVWRYVTLTELSIDREPKAWLEEELATAGHERAVAMMTSRDLRTWERSDVTRGGVRCTSIATVGLSNARRVGDPEDDDAGTGTPAPLTGTINLAVRVSVPLTPSAALEAITIAVEGRTTAVLESGYPSPVTGQTATGTGTDCVVLAWPIDADQAPRPYAGKHTDVGGAVGAASLEAVGNAVSVWLETAGVCGSVGAVQ